MSDLTDLDSRFQAARVAQLQKKGWTHRINSRGWHTLSRLWRGRPQVVGGSDLDALLERAEKRQADFEADLDRFRANRTPGVPVSTGLTTR